MQDLNSSTIVGRVTRDAELKSTSGGVNYTRVSIASNSYQKGDGDYVSFFDVVIWGKRAESLSRYLKKGLRIGVKGELRQSRWDTSSGEKRSRVEIVADNIQILDPKSKSNDHQNDAQENDSHLGHVMGAFDATPVTEDPIPF